MSSLENPRHEISTTSAGIRNDSLRNALVDLLGKPIAEDNALCIPTALYSFPGGPAMAYRFINGFTANPLCGLGWKSLGVLELTTLPSTKTEVWVAAVQEADALLVAGGSGNMTGTVATDRMFLASLIELGRQASE